MRAHLTQIAPKSNFFLMQKNEFRYFWSFWPPNNIFSETIKFPVKFYCCLICHIIFEKKAAKTPKKPFWGSKKGKNDFF